MDEDVVEVAMDEDVVGVVERPVVVAWRVVEEIDTITIQTRTIIKAILLVEVANPAVVARRHSQD